MRFATARKERTRARDDVDQAHVRGSGGVLHRSRRALPLSPFEIETLERIKILRGLRRGEFDVLIGINLLREGLDLPEVSLVAILDADKEGFLRSAGR